MNTMNYYLFTTRKYMVLMALFFLSGIFLAPRTWAGPQIFDGGLDTCTTLNCGAVFVNGISEKNAFGDSVPFILQVFADANECLRLDVTSQTADMEIVLISPSGSTWRNDDFNGTRPLVTAAADVKGYYTVQINYYSGNQVINTGQLFTLAYGRYARNTFINCSSPTAPTSLSRISVK